MDARNLGSASLKNWMFLLRISGMKFLPMVSSSSIDIKGTGGKNTGPDIFFQNYRFSFVDTGR